MMPNNWLTHNPPEDVDPSDTPKRRYIPSKDKLRKLAHASNEGGRFFCPMCRTGFSVTYGVFGRRSNFAEPEFYCRDCAAELPNFRKA